jgi:hypothetical protein
MTTKSLFRNHLAILILIVFCLSVFLLRLKFFSKQDFLLGYDSANYAAVADNITKGRGFCVDFVLNFYKKYPEVSHPEDRRLSINSVLIALIFLVTGKTILSAKLLNIFLGSLSLPLTTYFLARSLQLPKVLGLFAGLSVVVVHNLSEQTHTALADLLFAQFFLLFSISLIKSGVTPRWHYATGIFVGLSFLSKTQGIFLLPIWFFHFLFIEKNYAFLKTKCFIGSFVICILLMMPFLFRNYYLFNDPFYTTIKYNAGFDELFDTKPLAFLERSLKVYWDDKPPDYLTEIYHKGLFNNFKKVVRQIITAVHMIGYPFLILSMASLVLLKRKKVASLLWVIAIYVLAISIFFAFHQRYEIPTIPLLLVLSWGGVYYIIASIFKYNYFQEYNTSRKMLIVCVLCSIVFCAVHKNDLKLFLKGLDRPPLQFQESLIDLAKWAKTNLPPSAVVMTHDPALFNFYSGLKAVEIPFDSVKAMEKVISHYRISHAIPWTVDSERYLKLSKSGLGGNINILELNPSIPYGNLQKLVKQREAKPLYGNRNLTIYAFEMQCETK